MIDISEIRENFWSLGRLIQVLLNFEGENNLYKSVKLISKF